MLTQTLKIKTSTSLPLKVVVGRDNSKKGTVACGGATHATQRRWTHDNVCYLPSTEDTVARRRCRQALDGGLIAQFLDKLGDSLSEVAISAQKGHVY